MKTALAAILLAASTVAAHALDEVRLGTAWLAEGEQGGYYQAVADGTYEKYGLKVTIVPGGPQTQNRNLLVAGKLDFYVAGNMIQPLLAIEKDIPIIEVAAFFQKEPNALLVHPDSGIETFADIAKLPTIFLSKATVVTAFQWMKSVYPGFNDTKVKPYAYSPQPFLADKQSAQEGYVTNEPFSIEKEGGFKPKIFLLADAGFDGYASLIETRREVVDTKPDLVQRFVDASAEGWRTYLHGDNAAGNALIKRDNPEMTDDRLAHSAAALKEWGIVESGDAAEKGLGCMTDARQKSFYEAMAKAGVVPKEIDYARAYTTRFVCKGSASGN